MTTKNIPRHCQVIPLLFSHQVVSDSLQPYGLQHIRLSYPSLSPGFVQMHAHWVCDVIQPSHPLRPPSPPALNLSQHLGDKISQIRDCCFCLLRNVTGFFLLSNFRVNVTFSGASDQVVQPQLQGSFLTTRPHLSAEPLSLPLISWHKAMLIVGFLATILLIINLGQSPHS